MVTSQPTTGKRSLLMTVVRGACMVVGVGCTIGFLYTVIPWYYYHYDARNQIAAVARNGAVQTDEELKRKLAAVVKKAGIESEPRDFILSRSSGAISVKLHYTEACAVSAWGKNVELFSMGFDISVVADIQ
jgi:hypothetical protein